MSFGADFLGDWLDSGHSKDYAKKRNPNGIMSRHYQFESNLSMTGANADHRVPVKASELGVILLNLYNLIAAKSGKSKVDVSTAAATIEP